MEMIIVKRNVIHVLNLHTKANKLTKCINPLNKRGVKFDPEWNTVSHYFEF